MLPLAWALNIEYAPKRFRSTVVTVVMIGYSVGIALAGPTANWLIPQYSWQSLFAVGGTLSLVGAFALVLLLPESARFLASKGLASRERVAISLSRLTGEAVPEDAHFVVADEAGHAKNFNPRTAVPRPVAPDHAASLACLYRKLNGGVLPRDLDTFWCSRRSISRAHRRHWRALSNAIAGAIGGLLLMRFTDILGAIAITAMPLVAVPLLLAAAFIDLGHGVFLMLFALIALFLIGGHFGLHSIAGIFYPSAYRANGAGWATSVAKIGSIAGPLPPED